MNVLPLVFSFLALITILTYTRLSGFVVSKAVHEEYRHFIKNHQEGIYEKVANDKYRRNNRKESQTAKVAPQVKAHRYLNLYPLFQKEGEKSRETAWIFKNLITSLFSETKFYKEAISQNPRLVDDLVQAMQKAFANVQYKEQFKKGDLSTLELENPQLQFFLYKVLKDPEMVENEEDEELLVSKMATNILNQVISFNKTVRPIRIYLADKALLRAIFNNETVVDNIVAARKNYYRLVKKDPDRKEVLSDEFRSQFISFLPSSVQPGSINWDLSGTAPDQNPTLKKET